MLERATGRVVANFSTLFTAAMSVLLPIHLLYGWVTADVVAAAPVHDRLARLPPGELLMDVARVDLARYQIGLWVLAAITAALLPVWAGVARAAFRLESEGGVVTLPRILERWRISDFTIEVTPALVVALVYAIVIGATARALSFTVLELSGADDIWPVVAAACAVSAAVAVPWVGGVAASLPTDEFPRVELY